MLHTTFRLLRRNNACKPSYKCLARYLGGISNYGRETPIPLITMLDILSLEDVVWSLRTTPRSQNNERDKISRLFSCDCIEHILPLCQKHTSSYNNIQEKIDIVKNYIKGTATNKDLMNTRIAITNTLYYSHEAKYKDTITNYILTAVLELTDKYTYLIPWNVTLTTANVALEAAWKSSHIIDTNINYESNTRDTILDTIRSLAYTKEREWQTEKFIERLNQGENLIF